MQLRQVSREGNMEPLYAYWKRAMEGVPYCFDTSLPAWTRCLLEDTNAGEAVFLESQVWVAECDGKIAGFVQFGRPAFHYDPQGRCYPDPDIGVIRQLYFDRERPEVGEALLDQVEAYVRRFPEAFAFYHALGMGCQAYHGKLHERIPHVDALLRQYGFSVQHENVYYSLAISDWDGEPHRVVDVRVQANERQGTEEFSLYLDDRLIGSAALRYLAELTGGTTADVAYLVWIGVARDVRGQGFGRALMARIIERARERGCTELHADTALDNQVAQAFYDSLGFRNEGITRDYVRKAWQ